MKHSPEDLQKTMSSKTDEDLYSILHAHSKEYTPEAAEAARAEIERRHLDVSTLGHLLAAAEQSWKSNIEESTNPTTRPNNDGLVGLGLLAILGIIGAIIYGGYEGLDSLGWIPHREEAVISARSD